MNTGILFIILCCVILINTLSAIISFRIAKRKNLDLRRWIFYGFYFGIFALLYVIFKKQSNVD